MKTINDRMLARMAVVCQSTSVNRNFAQCYKFVNINAYFEELTLHFFPTSLDGQQLCRQHFVDTKS